MQKRRISVVMSKKEWILGLCWLPFYFLLLSLGVQLIFRRIAGRLPDTAELNAVYYAVNAAVVLLIFRRFLRGNLTALRKNRRKLPLALPTALLLYFFLTFAVGLIILALDPEFVNRNNGAVLDLLNGSPVLTWTLTVLAAPLIEETLFRGLIFGSLRRVSRAVIDHPAIFQTDNPLCLYSNGIIMGNQYNRMPRLVQLLQHGQNLPASA